MILLISVSMALIALYLGAQLLIKARNEALGGVVKFLAWFIIFVSFSLAIGGTTWGVRAMLGHGGHHGCGPSMMCGPEGHHKGGHGPAKCGNDCNDDQKCCNKCTETCGEKCTGKCCSEECKEQCEKGANCEEKCEDGKDHHGGGASCCDKDSM